MWDVYRIKLEKMGEMNLGLGNDYGIKSKKIKCLYDGIRGVSGVSRQESLIPHLNANLAVLQLLCDMETDMLLCTDRHTGSIVQESQTKVKAELWRVNLPKTCAVIYFAKSFI